MSTNTMRPPAQTIVYRHACNCDTANQPPGEHPEHRFDVDGKPFPWLITEEGAAFEHLLPDVYVCTVTILVLSPDTLEDVPLMFDNGWPHIDGRTFPWELHWVHPRVSGTKTLELDLAFLAKHVDTDGAIAEAWATP